MRAAAAIRHPLSFAGGGGEVPLQKKASPRRIWTRLREPRDECCAKDAKRRCKCVAAAAAAHELCAGGRACCLAEGNLGLLCNTCVRSRFILMHYLRGTFRFDRMCTRLLHPMYTGRGVNPLKRGLLVDVLVQCGAPLGCFKTSWSLGHQHKSQLGLGADGPPCRAESAPQLTSSLLEALRRDKEVLRFHKEKSKAEKFKC